VYRLAKETHKESAAAADFALKKLAVEIKVHELSKQKVYSLYGVCGVYQGS
jgi:hypothetical protein